MTYIEGMQHFKMLGYLASRDDVTITTNNQLRLIVNYCTDYPDSIDEAMPDTISVFVNNNFQIGYNDDESLDFEVRKNAAYEYFYDKWFIFNPSFSYNRDREKLFVNGYNVQVVSRDINQNPKESKFFRIPIFSPNKKYNSPKNQYEFEDALLKGKNVGQVSEWTSDQLDAPRAIVWQSSNVSNGVQLYTNIRKQILGYNGFSYYGDKGKVNRTTIMIQDNDWYENLISISSSNVAFIPLDVLNKYESLSDYFEPDKSKKNDIETVNNSVKEEQADKKEVRTVDTTNSKNENTTLLNIYTKEMPEKFIRSFKNTTEKGNLHYKLNDLINFHTAMECDGLVILSGLSGTGKSQLVRSYAKALGFSQKGNSPQLCFIPVRPFWSDDSDLLGCPDMVNNVYRAGESGLVETLKRASENTDKIYIVVFDEMNLARVEHYFSQFLSILEMPANERYIKLYNEQLENRLYNSNDYPHQIKIGPNVLFVGTVNTDESTFKFSDKVLDRSNVINLNVLPFNYEFDGLKYFDADAEAGEEDEYTVKEYYEQLRNVKEKQELSSDEKELLWKIHVALNKCDKNLGIGWRVVKQIDNFLQCLPKIEDGITRGEAFDLQIVQRVFTKIRGSEEQLKQLLGTSENEKGKLNEILEEYSKISNFNQSRETLEQKRRELDLYGFTM